MKLITVLWLVLSCFLVNAQIPAAIIITPADATAYDELTLIFDPDSACYQSSSLDGLDSIAIHSGVSYLYGPRWQHVVEYDSVGENGQTTVLYPTGDGRFSITYTPFEFYGFPEGSLITEICAVFNDGSSWYHDGRDFTPDESECMDFFIPLSLGTSCLPEGITFSSQSMIDNFKIVYPWCTEIEGFAAISGDDIVDLNGLDVLTSIGELLWIEDNAALTNLSGLDSLTFIGDGLIIINNALTSLQGLQSLDSVGGDVAIIGNEFLTDLTGLDSLTTIGDSLFIWNNPMLTSLSGLNSVSTLNGDLVISVNNALENLTGLEGLDSLGGDFHLAHNKSLNSLAGLVNLTGIDGKLLIVGNDALSSLSGIDNIDAGTIDDLEIIFNDSLSECEIQSICEYLFSPNGDIDIHDNDSGCNSAEEVEEACIVPVSGNSLSSKVTSHPNPFTISTTIEYELNQPETVRITFYNQFGEQVDVIEEKQQKGLNKVVWTPENLVDGIYYYKLKAGDQMASGKLVLLR